MPAGGVRAEGSPAAVSGSSFREQAVTAKAAEAMAELLRNVRRSMPAQSVMAKFLVTCVCNAGNQWVAPPDHSLGAPSAADWSTNQSGTEKLAATTVNMTNSNIPFQYSNCVWDEP